MNIYLLTRGTGCFSRNLSFNPQSHQEKQKAMSTRALFNLSRSIFPCEQRQLEVHFSPKSSNRASDSGKVPLSLYTEGWTLPTTQGSNGDAFD